MRLRGQARRHVVWSLRRLGSARREFARRPAFAQWHLWAALPDAEALREALRGDGIELRPLTDAFRTLEEATEYVQAALDGRAWDAAMIEADGALAALERIELSTGPPFPIRIRALPRRPLAQAVNTVLFSKDRDSLAAWRRLDVAVCQLVQARRSIDRMPEGSRWYATWRIEEIASPEWLRPFVRRAVSGSSRTVKAEVRRLLDEAREAADYAGAALDARSWASVPIDLERLDSALRAVRHIVQRESFVYLPEPWPLRLPARIATARTMRREATDRARKRWEEMQPGLESTRERHLDRESP